MTHLKLLRKNILSPESPDWNAFFQRYFTSVSKAVFKTVFRPIDRRVVCGVVLSTFCGGLIFDPYTGYASAVSDADDSLIRAYNDYYSAVRNGPKKTPDEAKKIGEQLVTPATELVLKAMHQEAQSKQRLPMTESSDPHGSYMHRGYGGEFANSGNTANEPPKPVTVEEVAPALDGSNVPRELEFPGGPKQAPVAPTGAAAPSKANSKTNSVMAPSPN